MNIPDRIKKLTETFDYNLETYKKGSYNETQLRREFIDPFFEELGWDITNKQGYAETYKDVIHEDAIKIGGVTKAPDYCFRIGGVRKFFLEAKKPAVNIREDIHPAYQLRRYGWSAKLPLSILTDFEEFSVYDCRVKPTKTDKSPHSRILYLKYTDYIDKWDEIANIFSREAILRGSFDKYVESKKTKKGTAEVDAAFLQEIERWRELLARNIALRNPDLTQRELNFAIQQTIDRIIFLRICEDRGIEHHGRLMALQNGENVYKRLFQLFRKADDKYNSGLFHFKKEKSRENFDNLTPNLAIDDKTLKDIFKNLYYPDSPYEFSVLPADILGQVYEKFLSKIIRLTPKHQAKIEEKPEVRKAGGVYYTPTYIVDYIVKNTLGKLVEGKKPGPRGGVSNLRILDPACGSGSFLIGAYQFLLDWHRDQYVNDGPEKWAKGKTPRLYQSHKVEWRLTTDERKRILLNNIYGVDIDQQAVEVTKLSLLLKVLEGEDEQSIGKQMTLFQERVLPDLSNNIKCGNSLIGPDFYENRQMSLLDEEEMYRVNAFDWNAEFPEIIKNGGFNAVIGNPPYIRIQLIGHKEADYFFHTFKTPTSKTDISILFLEHSLNLVSNSGFIGLISTSQWLSTDYGAKMRGMLCDGRLHNIVNFGSLPVFPKADTYPAIFILSPKRAKKLKLKRIEKTSQLNLHEIEKTPEISIEFSGLSETPWNLRTLDIPTILGNRYINWQPLKTFGKAYIGVLTGMDKVFVVDRKTAEKNKFEKEILFSYAYRGAEVNQYTTTKPNAKVIYPYREGLHGSPEIISEMELKKRCPNIHSYLLKHKDALRQRKDSRKYYAQGADWYRHLRPGSFNYIRPSKLIIKGIDTKAVIGLLKENTCFNGANCPGIIFNSLEGYSLFYFLGLLNSKVLSYHLRAVCPAKLGGYTRFNANNIKNTPIRIIDFKNSDDKADHDQMVNLVNQMLNLQKKLTEAKMPQAKDLLKRQIETTDKQIDQLVYELYDLTEEEIKIVESET